MVPWGVLIFGITAIVSSLSEASKISSLADAPTVKVVQGSLRGAVDKTADGTSYYKFLGIPYAKPPLGNLRFTAPQETESWSGVRDATEYGEDCLQSVDLGSEDCLFINVYTPRLSSGSVNGTLLPVMVFIHGSAFVSGSANIGPGQLMNYDVVMATIAYRLNLFGFTSIEGTDAPGNAGLKDQVAALRWIQKNIDKFGGDPNRVTIWGTNTGGASVQYHMLSPLSKGLFHRGISESGCALSPFSYTYNTQEAAFQVSSLIGKPANTTSQLISNLRAASAIDLIRVLDNVTAHTSYVRPFGPSIEFLREGEEPFLLHSPAYLVLGGYFSAVPYIIGTTKREGRSPYSDEDIASDSFWKYINDNLESYMVPIELGLAIGSPESKEVAQKAKRFYFGNQSISTETRETFFELRSDIKFAHGAVSTIRAHAKYSTAKTYNYFVTYGNATSNYEFSYLMYKGKLNGDTSKDAAFARSVAQLWTSFAKNAIPTASGEVTWEPVSINSYPYLELNTPNSLKYDLRKVQMAFWDDIYDNYHNASVTTR